MKRLVFLASIISFSFSSFSYAFDIADYLNPKLPSDYKDLKTNMDSGCQLRNPFNDNCVLFWTQFNEYLIVRGSISSITDEQEKGYATIPITCHILRNKLDGVTNPDSTDKNHKTGEENYFASYNIKFSWYVNNNPISGKQNFYINDNVVSSEFTSGQRDDSALANEYCTKGIINAIRSLNGTPI